MKSLSPFLQRILLFCTLFFIETGVTGSWIISTNRLLFPYGFWIYGTAGKVVLFAVIVLGILLREHIFAITIAPWRRWQTVGLIASLSLLLPFFATATVLLGGVNPLSPLTVFAHLCLIAMCAIAAIVCFPPAFLDQFFRKFRKEIGIALIISIVFGTGMQWLFRLWPFLSQIVLRSVVFLLSFTHHDVTVVAPLTIRFTQFSITVGQYCSGIESLLLLSLLYITMGCIDHKKISIGKYLLLFVCLLIGMMLVNIVRVYLIIQSGFIFSPQVAAKLFHTYLGMLLFLSYFLFTMVLFYPRTMNK